MNLIRRSFGVVGLVVLATIALVVNEADADCQGISCYPAVVVLSQDFLLDEIQRKRADRVRRLFQEAGMTQEDLAQAIGMDQSQLSKHLRGKLPWREKWLAKVAQVWNIPLMELLYGEAAHLPIAGQVDAGGEFVYPGPGPISAPHGWAPAFPAGINPDGLYVLELAAEIPSDRFFGLKPGALLYVERQGGAGLADGHLGVEVHRPGIGRLSLVHVSPHADQVCLTPLAPGAPRTRLPLSSLSSLDRVAWIRL
jgi:hypothetical protein